MNQSLMDPILIGLAALVILGGSPAWGWLKQSRLRNPKDGLEWLKPSPAAT
jgi:hypothetical protein